MKNTQASTKGRSFWQSHVKAHNASGLTQREYCRQNNISYWSFNPWKRKIENESARFHEISPTIVQGLAGESRQIEILVNDSIRISVPEKFSASTLRDILHALEALR